MTPTSLPGTADNVSAGNVAAGNGTAADDAGISDIEQIRRLTHEYAGNLDGGRLDELVSLFTDDGVWDGSGWGIPAIQGAKALREFFAATMASTAGTCHLTSNHIITVDGNSAACTAYFHAFGRRLDGSLNDSLGIYTDELVRTAQGWQFSRRSVRGLLTPPPAGS